MLKLLQFYHSLMLGKYAAPEINYKILMQKIKTGYAYLFFFFYNSVNKVKGNILVQWKSIFMLLGLEFLLIISLVTYAMDLNKIVIPHDFNKLSLLIIIVPLVSLKIWFFERNRNWERYISGFNAWTEQKQKQWNWMARLVILFVAVNLIISFYWMSQIDWSQYR